MLCTVEDIIKAVGNPSRVASLTGVTVKAVSNWKVDGAIPSRHFFAIAEALPRGTEIDRAVFGFKPEGARP